MVQEERDFEVLYYKYVRFISKGIHSDSGASEPIHLVGVFVQGQRNSNVQ